MGVPHNLSGLASSFSKGRSGLDSLKFFPTFKFYELILIFVQAGFSPENKLESTDPT